MLKHLVGISFFFITVFGSYASGRDLDRPDYYGKSVTYTVNPYKIFSFNPAWFDSPYQLFTVNISTPNGATGICPGGSLVLTASPGVPGSTYQWFNNGIVIALATQSTYAAVAAGSYTVTVTTAGVPDTSPAFVVTLLPVPVAAFTHSPDNQCSSTPLAFTSTSTGNNLTYTWDFGDVNSGSSNTSSLANPTHLFIGVTTLGAQTFPVKLTVTNDVGCSTTTTQTVQTTQPDANLDGTGATTYNGQPYLFTAQHFSQ